MEATVLFYSVRRLCTLCRLRAILRVRLCAARRPTNTGVSLFSKFICCVISTCAVVIAQGHGVSPLTTTSTTHPQGWTWNDKLLNTRVPTESRHQIRTILEISLHHAPTVGMEITVSDELKRNLRCWATEQSYVNRVTQLVDEGRTYENAKGTWLEAPTPKEREEMVAMANNVLHCRRSRALAAPGTLISGASGPKLSDKACAMRSQQAALPDLGRLALGVTPPIGTQGNFNLLQEVANNEGALTAFLNMMVPLGGPLDERRVDLCHKLNSTLGYYKYYNTPPPWVEAIARAALIHCGWTVATQATTNVRRFLDLCARLPSYTSPMRTTQTSDPPGAPPRKSGSTRRARSGGMTLVLS